MKDDIHNTVLVDSSADRAVLVSLGEVEKALQNVKGTKVQPLFFDWKPSRKNVHLQR